MNTGNTLRPIHDGNSISVTCTSASCAIGLVTGCSDAENLKYNDDALYVNREENSYVTIKDGLEVKKDYTE